MKLQGKHPLWLPSVYSFAAVLQPHGHFLRSLHIQTSKPNCVKNCSPSKPTIHQWTNLILYLILMPSYAKHWDCIRLHPLYWGSVPRTIFYHSLNLLSTRREGCEICSSEVFFIIHIYISYSFYVLRLKKGQIVLIPIKAINKSVETWGEDAKEFKFVFLILVLIPSVWYVIVMSRPERWESIPEGTSTIQGVWGNMLTFLGGPRACIGFRFALVEFVFLFHYERWTNVFVWFSIGPKHCCSHL